MRYFIFTLSFLVSIVLLSCSQNPNIQQNIVNVTQTNQVFFTNYITNHFNQTASNVGFSLTGIDEASIVQPYQLVEGVLQSGFSQSDVDKFYLIITNNNFSNNFQFYSPSNFRGVVSAPNLENIHVLMTLVSKFNSSYTVGINLKVSNIPIVKITSIQGSYVITSSDTNINGYIDISDPDTITNVSIIISNSSGVFTNTPTTSLIPSWTNVVRRVQFLSTPSLAGGYNYIKVRAVSSRGIVGESVTITILKSLFVIDGLYESRWNNARLVASASSPNPFFGWGIARMRVTNDGYFLYVFVSNYNITNLGDNGLKLSISIDTNSTSGLTNDAWVGPVQPGRFTYMPTNGNYPDIQIHMRLKQTNQINGAGVYLAVVGTTNFWTNIANTWVPGYDRGVMFGINNASGWEVALPLGLVGIQNGSVLRFIAVLGRPDGDDRNSALHVLPESPSNEITTNDGYFTNVIRVWSDSYTVSY